MHYNGGDGQQAKEELDLGKLQGDYPPSSHPLLASPFHLISHFSSTVSPRFSWTPLSCPLSSISSPYLCAFAWMPSLVSLPSPSVHCPPSSAQGALRQPLLTPFLYIIAISGICNAYTLKKKYTTIQCEDVTYSGNMLTSHPEPAVGNAHQEWLSFSLISGVNSDPS